MSFTFNRLEKKRFGSGMPEGVVRIRKHGITLSQDIADSFAREGGFNVALASDAHNQAIQLQSDPAGYKFQRSPGGVSASLNLPGLHQRLELPIGDYIKVGGEHNVFVLAK